MIIPKSWADHKELQTMKMQYNLPNLLTFYDHFCQQYYASESDKRGDIDWFIEKCAYYEAQLSQARVDQRRRVYELEHQLKKIQREKYKTLVQ